MCCRLNSGSGFSVSGFGGLGLLCICRVWSSGAMGSITSTRAAMRGTGPKTRPRAGLESAGKHLRLS